LQSVTLVGPSSFFPEQRLSRNTVLDLIRSDIFLYTPLVMVIGPECWRVVSQLLNFVAFCSLFFEVGVRIAESVLQLGYCSNDPGIVVQFRHVPNIFLSSKYLDCICGQLTSYSFDTEACLPKDNAAGV